MPRVPPLAVLLAALLVLAPVGAVVAGAGHFDAPRETANATRGVTEVANRTNYLMPDTGTVREEYATASVDVAGAVAIGARELHGNFERGSFRRAWSGRSEAAKRRLVRNELGEIRARVARLERERAALWEAFRAGEVSTATFLRRGLVIHTRASQLLQRVENVQQLLSIATEPPYIQEYLTPIDALRGRTTILMNRVSDNLRASLLGTAKPTSVYLLFAEDSLVMATAGGGQFIRLAHVSTNFVANGTDQFAPPREVSALTRFKQLYPWADAHAIRSARVFPFGNTTIYRGRIVHPQGELLAFMDGSSRQVFRELQLLRRTSVPVASTLTNNTADLALRVNMTGPTNPMHVEVVQSGTRAPVNGTVRIGGTVVGTTGESGSLWAVQPRGQFTVNVTVADDTVTVSGP